MLPSCPLSSVSLTPPTSPYSHCSSCFCLGCCCSRHALHLFKSCVATVPFALCRLSRRHLSLFAWGVAAFRIARCRCPCPTFLLPTSHVATVHISHCRLLHCAFLSLASCVSAFTFTSPLLFRHFCFLKFETETNAPILGQGAKPSALEMRINSSFSTLLIGGLSTTCSIHSSQAVLFTSSILSLNSEHFSIAVRTDVLTSFFIIFSFLFVTECITDQASGTVSCTLTIATTAHYVGARGVTTCAQLVF